MKQDTKSSLEHFFHQLSKHPFLSAAAMCLLLFFFGFCDKAKLTTESYIYAGVLLAAIFALLIVLGRIGRDYREMVVIFLTAAGFTAVGLYLIFAFDNSPALFLWLALFLLAMTVALMRVTDTLSARNFIILMIMAGVVLRYTYILYTTFGDRQHDIGYFNWTWGHANYIEYWYQNGLKLPDFDVRTKFQYYQPPLHHMLMALLLRILTWLGMEYMQACQALQALPFLYSSLIMVISYRIFRYIRLKGTPLVVTMAIICFHPTFLLMGGSFNNDILSVMLMLASIMFALKWYRKPTLRNIIPIALCIGCSMMAKLSGWMAAPAIAILFLYVFIKNIKAWKRYIGQFAVFGVISFPLGLWWQVRNYFAFKVPPTYIPIPAGTDHPQYCGDMSVFERLFNFSGGQLSYVYDALTEHGGPYDEFNPTLGLFKTSLFDEGVNGITDINFPQIAVTGKILFWVGAILGILCFVTFVVMMIRKKSGLDGITRVFFAVLGVTLIGTYYVFCFQYPYTCTMNIRYCTALIPILTIGIGLMLQRLSGDSLRNRIFRYVVCGLTAAFCVTVCIVYSQVAVPQLPAVS